MASVRKREWTHNGAKREAWVCSYTDQEGKRRLKTFDKKKEADAFRQKAEAEINAGIHTAASASVTVAEAVREFLQDRERQRRLGDVAGNTLEKERFVLERRLVAALGSQKVSELKSEQVQGYVDGLRSEGLAANTVRACYSGVVSLLRFAVRRHWVRRNVLQDEPCRLPGSTRRTAIPTKADIEKLLDHAEVRSRRENLHVSVTRGVVINLGLFAGLRPGEMFGLQWGDVDRAAGVLRIRHSYSRFDGLKDPKSSAGVRVVPLTPPVERALARLERLTAVQARVGAAATGRKGAGSEHLLKEWDRPQPAEEATLTGHVLLSREGKPYTPVTFAYAWAKTMKDAGLLDAETGKPKFTLHALRHAAASLWIAAGLRDLPLKTVMGHSRVSVTYDVYGHLLDDDDTASRVIASVAGKHGRTEAPAPVALPAAPLMLASPAPERQGKHPRRDKEATRGDKPM